MPRRSPSPDSFKRYHDSGDGGQYRGRRGGYRPNTDRESRDGLRDRGVSERDTRRRGYHDDDRQRRDDRDHRRRRERERGYDSHDDGRRRRDEEDRDRRYASQSRHHDDEAEDKGRSSSRRDDRGDRLRDDRDHRDRRDERGGSSRRSASPRRSRPHSRSRSRSASAPPEDKAKPNFAPSGLLAAATNTVKNADGTSTLLKYNEPPEARKPLVGWRLYVFKEGEQVGAYPYLLPLPFSPPRATSTSNTYILRIIGPA